MANQGRLLMANQGWLPLANQLLRSFLSNVAQNVLSFSLDCNLRPGRVKPLFVPQQAGMAGGWVTKGSGSRGGPCAPYSTANSTGSIYMRATALGLVIAWRTSGHDVSVAYECEQRTPPLIHQSNFGMHPARPDNS